MIQAGTGNKGFDWPARGPRVEGRWLRVCAMYECALGCPLLPPL